MLFGCLFHFGQSLYRFLKDSCRIFKDLRNNENIRIIFRKILNLPSFPIDKVFEEFRIIKSNALDLNVSEVMEIFFNYFERTYLGRFEGRVFLHPSYSIDFWSCYDRILSDIPRTNNAIEGWHSYLNDKAGISHPNIARFIDLLKNSKNMTHYNLLQISNGSSIPIPNNCLRKEYKLRVALYNFQNFVRDKFHEVLFDIYH